MSSLAPPILTLNSDLVCCDSGAKIKPQNMEKPVRQTDHTAMEDVCTELLSHLAFIKMYMIFFSVLKLQNILNRDNEGK